MALRCKCLNLLLQLRSNSHNLSRNLGDYNWIKAVNTKSVKQYQTSSKLSQKVVVNSRLPTYNSSEDDVKESILNAALNFVPQYGWSKEALEAGAEVVGLPRVAHGLFPKSEGDLVIYFYARCNSELEVLLQTEQFLKAGKRTFLLQAVRSRVMMISPYKSQWPQAMAIMSKPQNALTALKHLCELVDTVWYHAGDKSADFNWYTKRASLAAIYKSTELFFIQDNSHDFQDSWLFLENRVKNLESIKRCVDQVSNSGTVANGLFTTMLNMIGIQKTNR